MQEETVMRGYRLSPQQRQVWLAQQRDGGVRQSVYNAQCRLTLDGVLRVEDLKAAVAAVVEQHEILRTRFQRPEGMKTPVQVIDDDPSVLWRAEDLSDRDAEMQSGRVEQASQEEAAGAFNFEHGPLMRVALLKLSSQLQVMLLTLPSLCADHRTLLNLAREIERNYTPHLGSAATDDEPVQYLQFSEWQNELLEAEDEAEEGRRFWHELLLEAPATLRLPFETRTAESAAAHTAAQANFDVVTGDKIRTTAAIAINLDAGLTRQLIALAAKSGYPLNVVMQACWESLLWRLSGQHDLLVATLLDGRHYEELASALGLFARYVPLSVALSGGLRLRDLCAQIEERNRAAQEWQDYFNSEEAEGAARMPLLGYAYHQWQVSQPTENVESEESGVASDGLRWRVEQAYSRVQSFALQLVVMRRGESEVSAELEYDAAYYEESAARRVAGYYAEMLRSVARGGMEQRVSELELMGAPERAQVLAEMSGEQEEWESAKGVVERFEEVARESGERVALEYEGEALTYAELNARANQLARHLRSLGVAAETPVALWVERSLEMLVGLLGILKAGGAYVPLDAAYSNERLSFMLEDARPPVLLTQSRLAASLPAQQAKVVCLDTDWEVVAQQSAENLPEERSASSLAYVLFTSGSTGKPKGVAVEHRQLRNYVNAILKRLALPSGASFALVSTFAADLGNTVLFPSLCSGGRLHVISQERVTDPDSLADYFAQHEIDCLKIVPSHLEALQSSVAPHRSVLPGKRLVLGGEASRRAWVESLRQTAPGCRIMNHYGPTETTVGVLTCEVENGDAEQSSQTIPLGRPLANTRVYLLDAQLSQVAAGVSGELYIGGDNVARGYYNRPEATAERFLPDPFSGQAGARMYKTGDLARLLPDGQIDFLGRNDDQVKIRGYRIELGEIEWTLTQHPSVREAVVVAREDDAATGKRLVAYLVCRHKHALSAVELQDFLREKLPDYMIPAAYVVLKALPLNPNGKIERRSLPDPDGSTLQIERPYVAPRTPLEEVLAGIWADVLKLERIGVEDNFFALGGHSLIAMQIMSRVRNTFHMELPLRVVFEATTVEKLARSLVEHETRPGQSEKIAAIVKRMQGMSAEEKRALLKERNVSNAQAAPA
jgi:amino acid adenylation domain-containing protein